MKLATRRRPAALTLAVAVLTLTGLAPVNAHAELTTQGSADEPPPASDEDPDLDQTIDDGQEVVTGDAVIDRGHVDVGPLFVDGEWTLLIHDDVEHDEQGATSVWRYPDETVINLPDASALPVPDTEDYAFLDMAPGEPAYVVPQTQDPDVVWLGWNTQDPEVMRTIDRGVTLTMVGVDGPGDLVVYLQSGSFEAADVLWDSRATEPQPVWVEVNTHAHANWVFSDPGTYLVRFEVTADLIDGTSVSDTRDLRFAVGDDVSTDEAREASFDAAADEDDVTGEPGDATDGANTGATDDAGTAGADDDAAALATGTPEGTDSAGGIPTGVVVAIVAFALLLAIGGLIVGLRGRAAKRHAQALFTARSEP
jgi:surface-anchored protein